MEPTKSYFIDGCRPIRSRWSLAYVASCFDCDFPGRGDALFCPASPGDQRRLRAPLWSRRTVLDDADLQARNQRAWEHLQAERQLAIERRRVDIEEERLKLQEAAIAYGMAQSSDGTAQNWDPTAAGDWWYGGGFISPAQGFGSGIGFSRRFGFSPRIGFSRRVGISHRMGFSPRMGFSRR